MKTKLTLLFLFFSILFFAQIDKTIVKSWTSYVQAVDVSDKPNYNFRLTAKIRKDKDSPGNAGIWCRINKEDKSVTFFENQFYTVKVTEEWKTYTIVGKIEKDSKTLNFGAFAQENGDFYFDDFKLEIIKDNSKKWTTLPIENANFEQKIENEKSWFNGIVSGRQIRAKHFKIDYSSVQPFDGKYSLHIKGSEIIGSMPHGKYVDVNGIKLYYETYGKGEPLLMLHGNGQSINAFMNQVEDFSKKYQVIIVDCRDRGKSTYDKNKELTFDIQVEDMKQFLDKIGVKKVKILGWSDGGIIAILMAKKYPELVEKFAASGANIFPEGMLDSGLQELKDAIAKYESNNKDHQNDWLIRLLKLDYKYPNLKYDELNTIQCPALIIAGDKDEIKIEHTVKMFESIPKGQLAIIPNASHMVPEENPELFNSLVLSFFEKEEN